MERPQEKPQEKKLNQMPAHEHKQEEHKHEHKTEAKVEEKKETKAVAKITKKDVAVVNAQSLPISKKHSMYICDFIKGKPIDLAIKQLEEVLKYKRVIPMKGEIPHRSEPGVMSGRYPINASKVFIQLLKGLKGNAIVNQMDLETTKITFGSASWASRPMMRGGARFKRCNVTLKATEAKK